MRIIYDSEKPSHEKVRVEGYFNGEQLPVGCFDIKVEFSIDGRPHSEIHAARWGTLAKRKETHKNIAKMIAEARQKNKDGEILQVGDTVMTRKGDRMKPKGSWKGTITRFVLWGGLPAAVVKKDGMEGRGAHVQCLVKNLYKV